MDDTGKRLMSATKAYIASLGTTGVLLAASVLMLAVVSAVVALDPWPRPLACRRWTAGRHGFGGRVRWSRQPGAGRGRRCDRSGGGRDGPPAPAAVRDFSMKRIASACISPSC